LSTKNPTWNDPESNPGLRGERLAINRLSHGTDTEVYLILINSTNQTQHFVVKICFWLLVSAHNSHHQAITETIGYKTPYVFISRRSPSFTIANVIQMYITILLTKTYGVI
jgi:hypothetical protein